MNVMEALKQEQEKTSLLCVGLDTELHKIPHEMHDSDNPILRFNEEIISATQDYCSSYKINFAFYEQYGERAFALIKDTITMLPKEKLSIADAKRGDIGNTSGAYARAVFDDMGFDAITVSPYMGYDSVAPFLEYPDKIVFILALTSNAGSADFQRLVCNDKPIYRHVIETALSWQSRAHIGFVVGATHPDELAEIRSYAPNSCLLIPGVGTQGGNASDVLRANGKGPAVINVSRDILYGGTDQESAYYHARTKAQYYAGLLQ
ncbi:MAG TPA: orotidine-5'-phosphate decarboxylase [Candidatus Kapabacteria bacterium]|jgi:orotidine-5'-phosphate decarboxylase|nr:orotidine-5'-phosphate decarboxylase [Ignavibacteria bacterium]HRK60514.1 orotidine-5'-phosphate decarboxylase [Candidatus Kapabacteria bacterium]